jgi:hypothetical protein
MKHHECLERSLNSVARGTCGGRLDYPAPTAQWHAERGSRRPKTAQLAANDALRACTTASVRTSTGCRPLQPARAARRAAISAEISRNFASVSG